MQINQSKKMLVWGLWLISALIPLSLFFTGPIEWARNIEGPGLFVPGGERVKLDTVALPGWWQRFDLRVRCEPGQDCAALRAKVQSMTTGQPTIHSNKKEATFRLRINNPQALGLELINPGHQSLVVEKINLRNYSAINTGFPRFAVLLSPYPRPAFTWVQTFLLSLGTLFLFLPSLIFYRQQGKNQRGRWFSWDQLLFPWLILFLALFLHLKGAHLLLSWEALLLLPVPGYLFLALSSRFFREQILARLVRSAISLHSIFSRFFREQILVPLLVTLIAATFFILLGTVLGVGLPIRNFGPSLIYQTHFTKTSQYAGLAYLLFFAGLYWRKKEWFSPDRHLFLSSIGWVFIPAFIIYLANGYSDYGGDTTFNSLLPWKIVQGEGLFFSKEFVAVNGSWGLLEVGDAFLPRFPIGPSFLGLPTALIQYFWSPEPVYRLISWNQKVTAVWVAALSAAVIFQMVYLLTRKLGLSLLLSAAFALGTPQAAISAAVLWQHGPAVLLLCLGLLFLVKGQQEAHSYYSLAALPLAFLPLMRSQAVLFYLAGLASVVILQPKMVLRFFLWSLPGIAAVLWINLGFYHSILGGYAYQASGDYFATPFLEGAIGSLFSPNRGLLVFSPFLFLGIIGGGVLWAKRSVIAMSFGLAALIFFVIHAKYANWHGGWCVAPRFTSELVPVLVFFTVYCFLAFKKLMARLIGWVLIVISIVISLPGFFFLHEQGLWNLFPNVDYYRMERVWDYRDWLPFHFNYRLRLEHFKEVPAFAFVVADDVEPLKSKEYHYRVKAVLGDKPLEIIKLSNVTLEEGSYQIVFKGDAQHSAGAAAELTLGFIGHTNEEFTLPVNLNPSFVLTHIFEVKKARRVDVRLKMSGRGTVILDSVRIVPVKQQPASG